MYMCVLRLKTVEMRVINGSIKREKMSKVRKN